MNDRPMNIKEAAEFTGQTLWAVGRALKKGTLRGKKHPGAIGWLTSEDACVEWMRTLTGESEVKREGSI